MPTVPAPLGLSTPTPFVTEVRIVANADASLIEDATGGLANSKAAAGNFVGMTNNLETRRMLLAFDLSIIPAEVRIDSVTLEMYMSRTSSDESAVGLHRFTTAWSEGQSHSSGQGGQGASSGVGDPTWLHASYDEIFWETPGGDYETEVSAATQVGSPGDYQWASTRLTSDVESHI